MSLQSRYLVFKCVVLNKNLNQESGEDLKAVIAEFSKLKYEIQTDKPIQPLVGSSPDIKFYNDYLDQQTEERGVITYFSAIWLHTECYMYRKMREVFENLRYLNTFDPFRCKKEESFVTAQELMTHTGLYVLELLSEQSEEYCMRTEFINLLKLNLWGNKCDISLSNGVVNTQALDEIATITSLECNILSDHSERIWEAVSRKNCSSHVIGIP